MEKRNLRKERIGVVSSNKGDKTITVTVKWKEKHPIYGKFVNKTKKFQCFIKAATLQLKIIRTENIPYSFQTTKYALDF